MEWQFYSSGQSAVGIKTTHEEYIEFCKYHAPTPENLARREKERAELEKEKMQEKVESPLPSVKLEPTITEPKPIRRTRQRQHDDDFEL